MLIGLGFSPLAASGLSLIANTAPVAFGALGTPLIALANVTGLDLLQLSAMVGRQLPFFSFIVPFWLIWAFAGFRGMLEVWPAVAGRRARLRDPAISWCRTSTAPGWSTSSPSLVSMGCLALFLRVWQPRIPMTEAPEDWSTATAAEVEEDLDAPIVADDSVARAWTPWIILSVLVFIWGIPQVKAWLDTLWVGKFPVVDLHNLVQRVPPVVPAPAKEAAVYVLNLFSATGTGILVAAIIGGLVLGYSPAGARPHVRPDALPDPLLAPDHRLHAGARHRHPLLGHRRDARPRLRAGGLALPVLRHAARLARRGAHRLRHVVQRAVRRPAEDQRASSSASTRS